MILWSWAKLPAAGKRLKRPNLFTLLFVLLTFRVCEQFHQGRLTRRSTLWLLPLFTVWANVHGGFVAGLILLVAMIGAIVLTHRSRGDLRTPKVWKQNRRRPEDALELHDPAVGEGMKL